MAEIKLKGVISGDYTHEELLNIFLDSLEASKVYFGGIAFELDVNGKKIERNEENKNNEDAENRE